ncbi:MAG: sigma-70 family RNA polymerase sigma factor [Pseudomonadota bacterium]
MKALALDRSMPTGTTVNIDRDTEDRELIGEIVADANIASFERLYQVYRYRLGPFMHRFIKDLSVHEEAFNDVMMTVWRKAPTYNGTSKVSTWIYSIAYRHCLKALNRTRDIPVEADEQSLPAPDERASIERREVIDKALLQLSAEHRLVIELSYFAGHSYREIGEIADCPENTVKTRIYHARRKLKDLMMSLGETNAEELNT